MRYVQRIYSSAYINRFTMSIKIVSQSRKPVQIGDEAWLIGHKVDASKKIFVVMEHWRAKLGQVEDIEE